MKARQLQTLENYAYALARFEDFLARRGIDILERHESGKPFIRSDGTNLANALSILSPEAARRRALADENRKTRYRLGETRRLPEIRMTDFVCGETRSQRAVVVGRYLKDLPNCSNDPIRIVGGTEPLPSKPWHAP